MSIFKTTGCPTSSVRKSQVRTKSGLGIFVPPKIVKSTKFHDFFGFCNWNRFFAISLLGTCLDILYTQ